jgi:uncharacterized coiled-coil DUF342 family protein
MSTRDAYVQKLQAQMDIWAAKIDALRAKAHMAEADAKLELNKKIDELEAKQSHTKDKLAEIRDSGDDAWEDLKSGAERAWHDLGDAVKSATSRFS